MQKADCMHCSILYKGLGNLQILLSAESPRINAPRVLRDTPVKVLGASKVVLRFLIVQGVSIPTPALFKD